MVLMMSDGEEIKAVGPLVVAGELAKAGYDDAVKPLAKQIGQTGDTLGRAINVLLGPLRLLNIGGEQFFGWLESRLQEKLKDIPADQLVSPPPNVSGPTILALAFTVDIEELREMFLQLLATAMNSETANRAHPSFIETIKQMTPNEAQIIRYMYENSWAVPAITIRSIQGPIVRLNVEGSPGRDVLRHFTIVDEDAKCICSVEQILCYVGNLERLGVVEIPETMSFSDKSVYDSVEGHEYVRQVMEAVKAQGAEPVIVRRMIQLTNYGAEFCKACIQGSIWRMADQEI
jgi:hypothetical protein